MNIGAAKHPCPLHHLRGIRLQAIMQIVTICTFFFPG